MPTKRAFTLIELLVVVAIIVVLMALMAPALDAAMYRALFVKCAANQATVGRTFHIYAASFKRSYPYRYFVGSQAIYTFQLTGGTAGRSWLNVLNGYIALTEQFNDPMSGTVDLDGTGGTFFSPYSWYAGAHFSEKGANHQRGINRMGQRFEWRLDPSGTPYPGGPRSYDLIFADHVFTTATNTGGQGSHPDKEGAWANIFGKIPNRYEATAPYYFQGTIRISWWEGAARGPIDLNFTHDDGSVQKVDDVAFIHGDDERMDLIPNDWYLYNDQYVQVPSR